MNSKQRVFYRHWLERWQAGDPIDVNGNISYLSVYCYDVLSWHEKEAYDEIIAELRRLQSAYAHERKFAYRLPIWIADTYVLKGDYDSAFATMHASNWSFGSTLPYKRLADKPLTGDELYYFLRSDFSKYIRRFEPVILNVLSDMIREYEAEQGVDLIKIITKKTVDETYYLYNRERIPDYELDWKKILSIFEGWARRAENRAREILGIPQIGEGWVSEAQLYYIVSALLKPIGYSAWHHARPAWLKSKHQGPGQELDIYVPELKLAIEYMGRQHYEPIEYFGGKQAHEKLVKSDERKRRACEHHDIHLIYYRYDEPLEVKHVRKRLAEHPNLTLEMIPDKDVDIPKNLASYKHARDKLDDTQGRTARD
jgi:hypothetical protein